MVSVQFSGVMDALLCAGVLSVPLVFALVEKKVDGPKRLSAAVKRGPRAGVSGGSGMGYACLYHWSLVRDPNATNGEQGKEITPIISQADSGLRLFLRGETPFVNRH